MSRSRRRFLKSRPSCPRTRSEPAHRMCRRARQAHELGPATRAAPQRVPAAGPRRPGCRSSRIGGVGGQGAPGLHRRVWHQRQDHDQQRSGFRRRGDGGRHPVQPRRRQHGRGRHGGDAVGVGGRLGRDGGRRALNRPYPPRATAALSRPAQPLPRPARPCGRDRPCAGYNRAGSGLLSRDDSSGLRRRPAVHGCCASCGPAGDEGHDLRYR